MQRAIEDIDSEREVAIPGTGFPDKQICLSGNLWWRRLASGEWTILILGEITYSQPQCRTPGKSDRRS